MSRIDALLGMADNIATRSDKLASSITESNTLINRIMEMNSTISLYDSKIDEMSALVNQNGSFLLEFQKLYEKSFFLESNFGYNDCYTNSTSFSNLYTEYDFLWNEFHDANISTDIMVNKLNSKMAIDKASLEKKNESEPRSLPEPVVKHAISISNLHLKPLRCRDSKVSKQKSRYRLSEAYTLNPLLAFPDGSRDVLEGSAVTKYSNIMSDLDRLSSFSTQSSVSLPVSLGGSEVKNITFKETSDICGIPEENDLDMMQDHLNHASDVTFVNNSSMDHSQEDLTRTPVFSENAGDTVDSFDPSTLPLLFKSLHMQEYGQDIESVDYDTASLDSKFEEFDNFHHFLRRSRINLRDTLPEIDRARSQDSVPSINGLPSGSFLGSFLGLAPKFHNPADKINSQKRFQSTQPTVEAIYRKDIDAVSNFKEHSTKLLASHSETTRPESNAGTPKKSQNFDFFKLMNSPLGSPRGITIPKKEKEDPLRTPDSKRRNSVDFFGKSLTSTFMSLVNTNHVPANMKISADGKAAERSPPERIKKLKKDPKMAIAPRNDIKSKRLPPMERQLKNGSSSVLVIGPNRTKSFTHADSSPFKKPSVRRMSQSLLTDALNESILF